MRELITNKITRKEAGRLGGLARQAKYGNAGTSEGRRLGGLRSQETHRKLGTNFKQRKSIFRPRHSESFAEFAGIMLGDGHIGEYQAAITTNSVTDQQHAKFISMLATKLFRIQAPIRKKKKSNALEIVLSSYELCRFLEKECFVKGNKIHNNVPIPKWILHNQRYSLACLRGLFDTDGSVFLDKHIIGGVRYQYVGIAFVNRNEKLLEFFKGGLTAIGLHPTQKTRFAVFLRRRSDVDLFFKIVGSSNDKHRIRYQQFKDKSGRVA